MDGIILSWIIFHALLFKEPLEPNVLLKKSWFDRWFPLKLVCEVVMCGLLIANASLASLSSASRGGVFYAWFALRIAAVLIVRLVNLMELKAPHYFRARATATVLFTVDAVLLLVFASAPLNIAILVVTALSLAPLAGRLAVAWRED